MQNLGPEERIFVWEALRGFTRVAAYQYVEEDSKGLPREGCGRTR